MKSGFVAFLILAVIFCSCKKSDKLFRLVSPEDSGIDFNNQITESDSVNPINLVNLYNGGGVGIGDFNNDGLQDIYFTGNQVPNKLYLNKGDLEFEDVTEQAGVGGSGMWSRGVAVVDINNDGWLDMYVCTSIYNDPAKRRNLLYINQGKGKNDQITFREAAAEYGLDDTSHSTMANFFDYDNDGDLDVYIVVNEVLPKLDASAYKSKVTDGTFPSTGRLYRNDMHPALGHGVFINVTRQAGVTIEGYGHGATITDINLDGWKDIFVTNDFLSNDLLYINNRDGTFTDKAASYFKHTSANGMGQDVIDINNDGLADIVELDMSPEDNFRKKMMLNPSHYQSFQLNDFYKYQYQYVRNTIQLNQGPRVNAQDSIGDPIFGDAGYISGTSATDWSWTPLVADLDNDGWRDLVVTNGFPKDITDHDFMVYRLEASPLTPQTETLKRIPEVKLHNCAFKNIGSCMFSDVSTDWGLSVTSFSNGAAYADLDKDGDLDMVINNINDKAFLYENTSLDNKPVDKHYLAVELAGNAKNRNGLGAWVEIFYGKEHQVYEHTPYRGYLSTVQLNPYFGLGAVQKVDSLIVKWPDGSRQKMVNVPVDQTVKISKSAAKEKYSWQQKVFAKDALFRDVTSLLRVNFSHVQTDFIDFNIQKILPHKFSEYGPSLAAGDVNGDQLDDMIVGGNSVFGTTLLTQQANGSFNQKLLVPPAADPNINYQDMGILLFDADSDNDLDLYIARGGYMEKFNAEVYRDQFFINDGKGHFRMDTTAFPKNLTSKSCVRAADFDRDGDLDIFVAGRVDPGQYPRPVSSVIYRNDSKNGTVTFTDVTSHAAKMLTQIGMISDAIFTDFDNDGWQDLILAGEWMPVTFLKNEKGTFKDITATTGTASQKGWWNSIASGDFDNDGDMDCVLGNLGRNSLYQASEQHPVSVYAKDFDNNGSFDAFPSFYLRTSQGDASVKEYPVPVRDDAVKQMIGMRAKFKDYKSYATATMDQLFTKEELQGALILKATQFNSVFCKNEGGGKFTFTPLPFTAQLSALNGMVADDFDGDGNLDIGINTNDFSTDVSIGRYDALNGLVLKGDGTGNFKPQSILESGIFIPGNGKAFVKLSGKDGKYLLAGGQNRGPLKIFELKKDLRSVRLLRNEVHAVATLKNGKKQRTEAHYGASFLSQSARVLHAGEQVRSIEIFNVAGKSRTVTF